MRWENQAVGQVDPEALPGMARLSNLVRSVSTPDFAGMTFHEVMTKSALNRVRASSMPFQWTINPYRGCSHACMYCFARTSHRYLELNEREDFDREIIVKVNIVQRLSAELGKAGWAREWVALGTNTDPYQRAEGRYELMPGIISALGNSGTPLSILTKGTLVRRDLALLAATAEQVDVRLALSIAIMDDSLQSSLEPGAPSATARLATVRAARDAGLDVSVFLMPVIPFLTDTREHVDAALDRIRDAGATSVTYAALHLRPGIKEWFAQWLHRERPELVARFRDLYGTRSEAPDGYKRWLAARIKPLIAAHGLAG